jgi:hypothetical protein
MNRPHIKRYIINKGKGEVVVWGRGWEGRGRGWKGRGGRLKLS